MKNSTKLILVTAVLGTFSLGVLVKVVQADQLKPQVAAISQNLKAKVAKASDGDGETNDDATSSKSPIRLNIITQESCVN